MNNNIYKNKYIKYKNKYIKLKSQLLVNKQKKWPINMLSLIHQNGTNYKNLSNNNKRFVKNVCNKCGYKFDETEKFCKICYKLKLVDNHKSQNILNINMTERRLSEKSGYNLLNNKINEIDEKIFYLRDSIDDYNNNIIFYEKALNSLYKNIIIKEPHHVIRLFKSKKKIPRDSSKEDIIKERYYYFTTSIKINKKRIKNIEEKIKQLKKILLMYKNKNKELLERNSINITKESYYYIEQELENNPTKYLDWKLWNNISKITPSEFNFTQDLYKNKNYKLFNVKNLINSKWINLKKLITKYNKSFIHWHNDIKPDFINLTQNNKYPVYIQKLKVLDNDAKFCIIGDIHSSLHSLLAILFKIKNDYFMDKTNMILKYNRYLIFLGDIIDRGPYSMELLLLVLGLKLKNFNNVIIINGNHEDYSMYSKYGTKEEYDNQWKGSQKKNIDKTDLGLILNMFPSCLYLYFGEKIYHLSHGSFDYKFAGLVNKYDLPYIPKEENIKSDLLNFLQSESRLCLVSSNDSKNNYKWGDMSSEPSIKHDTRGFGIYQYGLKIIKKYLKFHNISNIISGHQDLEPFNLVLNNKKTIPGIHLIRSKIYSDAYLFQPELKNIKNNNIKFYLTDEQYYALLTSTSTVSRNMMYQNIYLELHHNY